MGRVVRVVAPFLLALAVVAVHRSKLVKVRPRAMWAQDEDDDPFVVLADASCGDGGIMDTAASNRFVFQKVATKWLRSPLRLRRLISRTPGPPWTLP